MCFYNITCIFQLYASRQIFQIYCASEARNEPLQILSLVDETVVVGGRALVRRRAALQRSLVMTLYGQILPPIFILSLNIDAAGMMVLAMCRLYGGNAAVIIKCSAGHFILSPRRTCRFPLSNSRAMHFVCFNTRLFWILSLSKVDLVSSRPVALFLFVKLFMRKIMLVFFLESGSLT